VGKEQVERLTRRDQGKALSPGQIKSGTFAIVTKKGGGAEGRSYHDKFGGESL